MECHQSSTYASSIKKIPDPELLLCKSINFIIPDARLRVGMETLSRFKSLEPCKSAPLARRSGTRRHQHFISTPKIQRLLWLSIRNPRLFGSSHHLTALSRLRRNSCFPRISSLRPTRLLSHPGGQVGDRVSLSRTVIQWSPPSLISCWKPFCACTRAIQGSA